MDDATKKQKIHNPWLWVVSNFVAMGIPFSMVIWVAGSLFKDLGHSDGEITVATASIGVVWSLKPLWAGFLDMFRTKKFFVLSTELVMGVLFVLMGLALNLESYFGVIIGLLWLVAFASATQDICSDGIYISSLDSKGQARFIGVQSMAWNLGRVVAVALYVWIAGHLQEAYCMEPKQSWMYALFVAGGVMVAFGAYHSVFLPTGSLPSARVGKDAKQVIGEFIASASDFCNKRALWMMLAFVFFYRSAEGLLLVEAPLFMQGCIEDGALQLSLVEKGTIDGAISTLMNVAGGLLGGAFIARFSLRRTLFVLALCVNVPNLCYVYLSQVVSPEVPLSLNEIAVVVSMEKFWYGFGFVGNMLYMMQQLAPGKFKMTHYAFATAFMNAVLTPTQMASGPLAESMGFKEFFILVMVTAIPSLVAAWFAVFPQAAVADEKGAYVDDPARLSPQEKADQSLCRAANAYALLAIALFLLFDVLSIGWISSANEGAWLVLLLVLVALSSCTKFWLCLKALSAGRRALAKISGGAYFSNARGAMIGGGVMLAVTLGFGYWTAKTAVAMDWDCAFSDQAKQCRHPDTGTRQCASQSVDHGEFFWQPVLDRLGGAAQSALSAPCSAR